MPRYQGEYISKEVDKLEEQIKERYGKKAGGAMLVAARQNVEYELDSSNYSQMQFVKLYTEELKRRL